MWLVVTLENNYRFVKTPPNQSGPLHIHLAAQITNLNLNPNLSFQSDIFCTVQTASGPFPRWRGLYYTQFVVFTQVFDTQLGKKKLKCIKSNNKKGFVCLINQDQSWRKHVLTTTDLQKTWTWQCFNTLAPKRN